MDNESPATGESTPNQQPATKGDVLIAPDNSQLPTLNSQLPLFPRAPGESPRAFGGFTMFFQLGHTRTLQACADRLDESIDTVRKWSSKFAWRDRIQSFNAGILQQQAESEAVAQREQAAEWSKRFTDLRRQEWTAAQKLLAAVQYFLETCGEEQLQKMTLSQVARALNISSSISRLAITGADLPEKSEPAMSPIQIQLTEALNRMYGPKQTPPADATPPLKTEN